MQNTTLIYLEKDGQYLMLNRNKKQDDQNSGKWLGIGGKFNDGEMPEECAIREIAEETGLSVEPSALVYRGIVTFVSDACSTEYMHLFTCDDFHGKLCECNEGELEWIDKDAVLSLPLWEGDREFLRLIYGDSPFFSMKLVYEGERLVNSVCKIY